MWGTQNVWDLPSSSGSPLLEGKHSRSNLSNGYSKKEEISSWQNNSKIYARLIESCFWLENIVFPSLHLRPRESNLFSSLFLLSYLCFLGMGRWLRTSWCPWDLWESTDLWDPNSGPFLFPSLPSPHLSLTHSYITGALHMTLLQQWLSARLRLNLSFLSFQYKLNS